MISCGNYLPTIVTRTNSLIKVSHKLNRVISKSFIPIIPKINHIQLFNEDKFFIFKRYLKENPTATYDLSKPYDPGSKTFDHDDYYDEYTKLSLAALKAGKSPPRKKKRKYTECGELVGIRIKNTSIPLRIRSRLISEGMQIEPHFYIGRYGLNAKVVDQIRSAFRRLEIVRLDVAPPWKDNLIRFSERLEKKTGGIVIDRAGSRFLLYRGFTHADLARKGLISPDDFNVGDEYEILLKNPPRVPKYYILKKQAMEKLKEKYGKYQYNSEYDKEITKSSSFELPSISSSSYEKIENDKSFNRYKNDDYSKLIKERKNIYNNDEEIDFNQSESESESQNESESEEEEEYNDLTYNDDLANDHEDVYYIETEEVLERNGLTPIEDKLYKMDKKSQHKIIEFDNNNNNNNEKETKFNDNDDDDDDDIVKMDDEKLKEVVGNLQKTAEVLYAKIKKPVPHRRKGPRHKR